MPAPANHGKPWTDTAEATVWGLWILRATIKDIMMAMGREEEAIKARLERLGIMRWTGFSREETGKAKRQAASEEQATQLWQSLSDAYHTYNPNGVWHCSTGHKEPATKAERCVKPDNLQHIVIDNSRLFDSKDFNYSPALKEQILRHLYGGSSERSRGVGDIQDAMAYAMCGHKSQGGGYISTATQPQQEKPMSIFKSVTTNFVHGNDAANLSDDELFAQLARGEQQLDKLKAIKTPSKKLAAQIEDMQDQLTKLAEYIDSRK